MLDRAECEVVSLALTEWYPLSDNYRAARESAQEKIDVDGCRPGSALADWIEARTLSANDAALLSIAEDKLREHGYYEGADRIAALRARLLGGPDGNA